MQLIDWLVGSISGIKNHIKNHAAFIPALSGNVMQNSVNNIFKNKTLCAFNVFRQSVISVLLCVYIIIVPNNIFLNKIEANIFKRLIKNDEL